MEAVNGTIVRTVSQYSVEVRILVDRLLTLTFGEEVSYDELTRLAGMDVRENRHLIQSARKQALNEGRVVISTVRGRGYRRMNDDEIAGYGTTTARRIGRQARQGIKVVSAGEYEHMSPSAKVTQAIGLTVLNMIQHSASRKAMSRLETALPQNAKVLPLAETLKHLAG